MPQLRLEQSLVDDRYEIADRLGLGSYSEIFVARDRQADGRQVVIKALNTSLQGTPDVELERTLIENFQNEAICLDAVRHPHVILRLGHGTAADLLDVPFHFLVLEYMPGGDLLELCRARVGSALSLGQTLSFFQQACEALAFAHSRGIIHRDLKPNNFLLSGDHRFLKVADFGVAKLTSDAGAEITRVGAGTYAPPEHHPDEDWTDQAELKDLEQPVPDELVVNDRRRVNGGRRLTYAADIYSLAKSVYTVVCGRAPSRFVRQQITSLPPGIADEPWAGDLLKVLRRATATEVDERHQSVVEFWNELASVGAFVKDEVFDDELTRVRPKLKVNPGTMPSKPEQPDFEPVLASSAAHGAYSNAPQATPAAGVIGRSPKIVVDLRPHAPLEVVPSAERIASGGQAAVPQTSAEPSRLEAVTAVLRRVLLISVLVVALIGALAGTYMYARRISESRVEIVAPNGLFVRSGPSPGYEGLGVVPHGSHHRLLTRADNGWIQIRVLQWDESTRHPSGETDGWINGSSQYVSVADRRWW